MKSIMITCVFLASGLFAQTQQATCSAAMQGKAGNFIISYTIGELVLVDSWKNNGLWITQGVHQPVGSVINAAPGSPGFLPGEITVFPNPTPNRLSIQVSLLRKGKMIFRLYNVLGQLLLYDQPAYLSFRTYRYSLAGYPSGSYLLTIEFGADDGIIKKSSYTIIKH